MYYPSSLLHPSVSRRFQTTIGRPNTLTMSDDSAGFFGSTADALVWLAYGLNVAAEICAFFLLCTHAGAETLGRPATRRSLRLVPPCPLL